MLELVNALPHQHRAEVLTTRLEDQLKSSIIHLFEVCEEVIGLSLYSLKESIHSLDVNPFHHAINSKWIAAVETEDISKIHQCVSFFNLPEFKIPLAKYIRFKDGTTPEFFENAFDQEAHSFAPVRFKFNKPDDQLFQRTRELIGQARDILSHVCPEAFMEHEIFVKNFLLFDCMRYGSGTSFTFFGMIATTCYPDETSVLHVLDMLVHETAHLYIFALSASDELVLNPSNQAFTAPFRKDPRPMLGIFHAAFVLARLIYVFTKMLDYDHALQFKKAELVTRVRTYVEKYDSCRNTIQTHGKLTDIGHHLIESTHTMVTQALHNFCNCVTGSGQTVHSQSINLDFLQKGTILAL